MSKEIIYVSKAITKCDRCGCECNIESANRKASIHIKTPGMPLHSSTCDLVDQDLDLCDECYSIVRRTLRHGGNSPMAQFDYCEWTATEVFHQSLDGVPHPAEVYCFVTECKRIIPGIFRVEHIVPFTPGECPACHRRVRASIKNQQRQCRNGQ